MFCPKCGTQNPETGKFCRSCGTDLGNVAAAMSGPLSASLSDREIRRRNRRGHSQDPHDVYAGAIRSIILGVGFFIVSMALLLTNVAGGNAWWWAMLFPAFALLARGISDYMRYGKLEQATKQNSAESPAELNRAYSAPGLPPQRTEFVSADEERYKTGDLVPPSVTDGTTRHLETNSEGETMTLPKKQ